MGNRHALIDNGWRAWLTAVGHGIVLRARPMLADAAAQAGDGPLRLFLAGDPDRDPRMADGRGGPARTGKGGRKSNSCGLPFMRDLVKRRGGALTLVGNDPNGLPVALSLSGPPTDRNAPS